MSLNLVNKKRTILENLNVHLQVQAVKLNSVNLETNILPKSLAKINDKKPIITSKNQPNKTKVGLNVDRNILVTQKQKTRKLKPYDPLYTWNRGGRLKELRIRCQARKYFRIWMLKSLGRVKRGEAEKFYRTQLIKKCWNIWYDQYWQLKIEPRLFGRAIIHRKCIIMRSTFLAWKWWIQLCKLRRVKMQIAINYSNNHRKKLAVNIWLSWIFVRKCKMKLTFLSENMRRSYLLTHFYMIWKDQLLIKRDNETKMVIAIKHNSIALLSKVWHHWTAARPHLRQENIGNLKAFSFYKIYCLKKYLNNWTQYHQRCKIKQKEHVKYLDHYHWILAKRCLNIWKEQYIRSLTMSVVNIRVTSLGNKFQLRRIFFFWKIYMIQLKEKKIALLKANNFYHSILKRKVWLSIVDYIEIKKKKQVDKMRANTFNKKITLGKYLDKWLETLDHKDDQDRRAQMGAARAHYRSNDCVINRTTFIKCFRQFSNYVDKSKNKKDRKNIADKFRQERVLQRSIVVWLQYVIIQKRKKEVLKLKNKFLRDRVILKELNHWRDQTTRKLTAKQNLKKFVQQKMIKDKKRLLTFWRFITDRKRKNDNSVDRAIYHYQEGLLNKYLTAMKQFVQQENENKCLFEMACNHYNNRIVVKTFQSLRLYTIININKKSKVDKNIFMKEYKIKKAVFNSWRILIENVRLRNNVVENLFEYKTKEILQRRFKQWRKFVRIRKDKKYNTARLVLVAKREMDIKMKMKIINIWNKRTLESVSKTNNYIIAKEFYKSKLLGKTFNTWKQYHINHRSNFIKREQAASFCRQTQITKTWVMWTKSFLNRQREQYYTKFALSHWATKLQERVLRGWIRYKNDSRQNRDNESEAFAMFQKRVKRYTIGQWLRSSDFLWQWRQSQNKCSNNTSTCASRAFSHWRQWTEARVTKTRIIESRSLSDIKRPKIKFLEQKSLLKSRPAPKIPDFLLSKPINREDTTVKSSVNISNSFANRPANCNDGRAVNVLPSDLNDEVLLPPASFIEQNTQEKRQQNLKKTMKELNSIKERLLSFKEKKESLKKLKMEVKEYDEVLTKLSFNHDSSFYQEFDPVGHREELVCHIKKMEEFLAEELPICNQLSKRAQDIVNGLNS